jgi:hypothetical protein
MPAHALRLHSVELFERPVTLRLPFRFGAATVTRCPQAFVRMEADVGGKRVVGATAELMVPKWFDKSPDLTHEQNFEQLRMALRLACDAYQSESAPMTPHQLSLHAGAAAIARGVELGLPRLAAQFGPAELDKALADVALRAAGLDWVSGLRAGILGDPFTLQLELHTPAFVNVRHTVGLADRLTASDPGTDPHDGLPATLEAVIARYGLRFFKIKLSGNVQDDIERLVRIAAVLDASARDWRLTLDGNETLADASALDGFWQELSADPRLHKLLQRTLLLEQPLPRRVALDNSIARLDIDVPVILDESDDHPQAFEEGIVQGYRGISTKSCKGLYGSLAHALRVARDPRRLVLSAEDLTCQPGLALQQDTLLAASLGVMHVERNGHHYVDGFATASDAEAEAFADAHPGLYDTRDGRVRLAVRDGHLDLTSLHVSGFASAALPRWSDLTAIH